MPKSRIKSKNLLLNAGGNLETTQPQEAQPVKSGQSLLSDTAADLIFKEIALEIEANPPSLEISFIPLPPESTS
jgi:hypothetical protein